MNVTQKISDSVALLSGMIAEDSVTGEGVIVKATAQAANIYVASLTPGDNAALDVKETLPPGNYITTAGVTSGVDINLGSGKAGNKLVALHVFNNSGSAFTAFDVKDGATTLSALDLGTLRTLATGTRASWNAPGGALEGRNTGWRVNITCAGTMANIAILAVISE